ncbi:unnamed protein product [Cylicostephanus goldi]|uniref:Uncharacterized protein n=1 Tax=Cylicostephanus goldi TaxID=71465 RepID=A0A3P6RKN2_CYLGO|nr:unnamed protein product [Cylicostephanus goldi]
MKYLYSFVFQLIDLKLTRNLSIMGLSLLTGQVLPHHIEISPIRTGNADWDQIINMLLSIKMLVGGVVAVILDNSVPGATLRQRGLKQHDDAEKQEKLEDLEDDGYAFPKCVNR